MSTEDPSNDGLVPCNYNKSTLKQSKNTCAFWFVFNPPPKRGCPSKTTGKWLSYFSQKLGRKTRSLNGKPQTSPPPRTHQSGREAPGPGSGKGCLGSASRQSRKRGGGDSTDPSRVPSTASFLDTFFLDVGNKKNQSIWPEKPQAAKCGRV